MLSHLLNSKIEVLMLENNPCNKNKSLISSTYKKYWFKFYIQQKYNYSDYQNRIVINEVHNVTKMNEIIWIEVLGAPTYQDSFIGKSFLLNWIFIGWFKNWIPALMPNNFKIFPHQFFKIKFHNTTEEKSIASNS